MIRYFNVVYNNCNCFLLDYKNNILAINLKYDKNKIKEIVKEAYMYSFYYRNLFYDLKNEAYKSKFYSIHKANHYRKKGFIVDTIKIIKTYDELTFYKI